MQDISHEKTATAAQGSMAFPVPFVIAFAMIGFPLLGWAIVLLVGTAMSLALLAYRFTTYKSPRGPSLLPYYLLTADGLRLHVLEEHFMGFPAAMRSIFELTAFEDRVFLVSFGFILPVVFLLGAVGLFCRTGVLDFEHVDGDDELDDPSFSVLAREGGQLILSGHRGDGQFGQVICITTDDVDALFRKFRARCLYFLVKPFFQFGGNDDETSALTAEPVFDAAGLRRSTRTGEQHSRARCGIGTHQNAE